VADRIGFMRRLDSLLLTGVGVLLVHQSAYAVSSLGGYKTAVTHGHLEVAWLFGSLTAIGALARAVTRSLRKRRYAHDHLATLTMWIVSGYLVLETFERVANDLAATSLLSELVFWLGLLFAPLVALVLRWSMQTVARIVADAVASRDDTVRTGPPPSSLASTSVRLPAHIFFAFTVSRRGPPRLLHI
jgi:lysylphosphatidylglycerol synthetase-like protein (DUF2156 family)